MCQRIIHPSIEELCCLIPSLSKESIWQAVQPSRSNAGHRPWASIKDGKLRRIIYKKIPETSQLKHQLPATDIFSEMLNRYREQKEIEKQAQKAKPQREVDALYRILRAAMQDRYVECYNLINQAYSLPTEKIRLFAERWAVWQYLADNYQGNLEQTTAALAMLFPGWFDNKRALLNFFKKYQEQGMEACIDSRSIAKAQKRVSSFVLCFLKSQYVLPQKPTPATAHAKLVEACKEMPGEKPCSLSSVKLYYKDFSNNIELYAARYGQTAAQKQLPYAKLLPAEHINSQWQADGWKLPFWGQEFDRYTIFYVLDNHSRRIVGWSFGKHEDTRMILEGLEDAMRSTGFVAAELVSDKHSFHKTDVAAQLKSRLEAMGGVFTVTENAQRNQLVERCNQYLDKICADFEGYIGKNITARGRDARPSPEALVTIGKPRNQKTTEEIKTIAAFVVAEYNRTAQRPLGDVSPNEKYLQSESKKAFKLSDDERVKLLRPASIYKVLRGQITIKLGMIKHEFQLPSTLIDRYNNQSLEVVYEDLNQGIYIYDPKSGTALGSILPKPSIRGAIADQTEEDKRRLNQQTGRRNGTVSKAKKSVIAKIADGLKQNPEAIELINHHSLPKGIRQIAEQDAEVKSRLRDMEVNREMLPIRQQTSPILDQYKEADETRNSPFSNPNHKIKRVSMDDIYGNNDQQ